MDGTCRICGIAGNGEAFDAWVRPTFTDWDKLKNGEIICTDCLFWFEEQSEDLARIVGKDKPQRMRNYSHFVVSGEWIPLSKGDKRRMAELLLSEPFPELAVIAESGQKHIAFRAPRNPPGCKGGLVQFEEQSLFLNPEQLHWFLYRIEALYGTFSKTEIETGRYRQHRIRKFGVGRWMAYEDAIKPFRESLLFKLALFLAQKGEDDGSKASRGGRSADVNLARDSSGFQEPLSNDDLAAVRRSDPVGGIHEQTGKVRQLDLFETGR